MARGRRAQNPILPNKQLLNPVRSTNLGNQLHGFRVIVAPIASNDERCVLCALGDREEDAGDEGFGVVWLLEGCDFLAKAGSVP